jgi:hypothetical protein
LTSDTIKEFQVVSKGHFKDLEKDDPGGAPNKCTTKLCMIVLDGIALALNLVLSR